MNTDDLKMEEENDVEMEQDEDSSSEEEHDSDRASEDDDDEAMDNGGEEGEEKTISRVYIPNVTKVTKSNEEGADNEEELEVDMSAYVMYHRAETGFPCLSFDVIQDGLGSGSSRADSYPMTSYLVAGTQANKAHLNNVLVLKMDNITATKKDDDDEDEVDDDEEELPNLHAIQMSHNGCINRIRSNKIGDKYVAATWSELGSVHLWDLSQALEAVDDPVKATKFKQNQANHKPIYSFKGHPMEGFAMDWAPNESGTLATGDCQKNIFLWKLFESGWSVDMLPLAGHTDSVEDLQWSPNQENILASCSVDKTVRIWDVRTKSKPAITVEGAHTADVNVINWNKNEKAFILSASDDGLIKVWDMRMFGRGTPRPVATFKHHHAPITSVEWHPTDGTVFAASSEDDQITIWDLAVESDTTNGDGNGVATSDDQEVNALPPQLLFIHQGQKEMKELHWHPQIPGVLISTALTGFDVFRTISV